MSLCTTMRVRSRRRSIKRRRKLLRTILSTLPFSMSHITKWAGTARKEKWQQIRTCNVYTCPPIVMCTMSYVRMYKQAIIWVITLPVPCMWCAYMYCTLTIGKVMELLLYSTHYTRIDTHNAVLLFSCISMYVRVYVCIEWIRGCIVCAPTLKYVLLHSIVKALPCAAMSKYILTPRPSWRKLKRNQVLAAIKYLTVHVQMQVHKPCNSFMIPSLST